MKDNRRTVFGAHSLPKCFTKGTRRIGKCGPKAVRIIGERTYRFPCGVSTTETIKKSGGSVHVVIIVKISSIWQAIYPKWG